MFKSSKFLLPLVLLSVVFAQNSWAVPCASWQVAESSLRSAWAKGYPNEKILKLTQNGEPSAYDKLKSTNQEKIDAYGDKWEAYARQKFCRVPATALVNQDGGQRQFDVSAIFVVNGNKYTFDDIGVGASSAVAQAGQEAPGKDEIKKMLTAFWLQAHPGTKVERIATGKAELNQSEKRWWYYVGADIYIVNEEGQKQKCSSDYGTIYKGEKGQEGVNPSGPWKAGFLVDPSCD